MMLTWMIYALIVVALLALLPFVVLGWWDVADRWRAGSSECSPWIGQKTVDAADAEAVLRNRELRRMAALCQIGQSAGVRPKEGD